MTERRILHAHWHLPYDDADLYAQLLAVAEGITPRVQAIPPDAAHLDITGALRYWQRDPEGIAALLRLRTLALHGVQTTCAIAPNRMLATMVAAATPPGMTTVIDAKDVERWLRPRPVAALYGVGPATTGKLRTYGLHTVGDVAETPMPTLIRLFGAAAGRALHAHAHGQDPRTVQTQPIAKSLAADRAFEHDVLDPAEHRRTLLDLAEEVAARLRDGQQAAGGLALSVRYADRSVSTRSRTLAEATAHTRPIATTAYELYDLLALQRARVRAISLRAHDLRPASEATQQLTLDPGDERALAIEAVTDRARARYGPGTIRPATLPPPNRPAREYTRSCQHSRHPKGTVHEHPPYVLRGPARGPLASRPGMTVSPCRTDDLGGGVTGPGAGWKIQPKWGEAPPGLHRGGCAVFGAKDGHRLNRMEARLAVTHETYIVKCEICTPETGLLPE